MSVRRKIFKTEHFQKQMKKYSEHCCVPLCSASSKFNGILSFHGFPTHNDLRRQWLVTIRRDHFTISSHTKVCSRHFSTDQLIEPTTLNGRKRLVKGAVPTLFEWNGYTIETPRRSVWERTKRPIEPVPPEEQEQRIDGTRDHDYCSVPEPSALDMSSSAVENMSKESEDLRTELQELRVQRARNAIFAMTQSKTRKWCCVPMCKNSKQKQPYLSFHCFPEEKDRRRKWVQAIRREEGPLFKITKSTHVCSLHFKEGDVYLTPGGINRVRGDAVPCRFPWADGSSHKRFVYKRDKARLGSHGREVPLCKMEEVREEKAAVTGVLSDHDYHAQAPQGTVDSVKEESSHWSDGQSLCYDNAEIISVLIKEEEIEEEIAEPDPVVTVPKLEPSDKEEEEDSRQTAHPEKCRLRGGL
ncbi:uncharacterized protein LOC118208975 [Anguilla anguilla]|uniref:uncharacterized protein LOC118208975 n=1 Tax=Anguilla anguilla TaxID=7936 RepID=UPI0015A9242C|nr:uncharacterized protein LOC118208975 [Anguilla anguilla]